MTSYRKIDTNHDLHPMNFTTTQKNKQIMDKVVHDLEQVQCHLHQFISSEGREAFRKVVNEAQERYGEISRHWYLFKVYTPQRHIDKTNSIAPILVDRYHSLDAAHEGMLVNFSPYQYVTVVYKDNVDFDYLMEEM